MPLNVCSVDNNTTLAPWRVHPSVDNSNIEYHFHFIDCLTLSFSCPSELGFPKKNWAETTVAVLVIVIIIIIIIIIILLALLPIPPSGQLDIFRK